MRYWIDVSRLFDETFDWADDDIIKENCPGEFAGSGAGFGYRDISFELDYPFSKKDTEKLTNKLVSLIGDTKGLTIEYY